MLRFDPTSDVEASECVPIRRLIPVDSTQKDFRVDLTPAGFVLSGHDAVYGQHSEAKASIRMRRMDSAKTSVSFALTKHPARNGRQAIVLHLYRDIVPVVTKTLAVVDTNKAAALLLQCRHHLQTLGVESIAHRVSKDPQLMAKSLGRIDLAN